MESPFFLIFSSEMHWKTFFLEKELLFFKILEIICEFIESELKPINNINEPKYLPHIAREICELIGVEMEELKFFTSKNAVDFFS